MRITRYCLVIAVIASSLLSHPAGAVEAGSTNFPPVAPLLVTAYTTSNGGKDIEYVEVYNTGKTLVRLQDWNIVDVQNARTLQIHTNFSGWLLPATHVVVSKSGVVANASFVIDGWDVDAASPSPMTTLRLSHIGYRNQDISILAANYDRAMTRAYNTDSYSTAASPFVTGNRGLFDDGLYAAPVDAGVVVTEIYPYASSCSPFDSSVLCGDYIKLYNPTAGTIDLSDMVLRTDSGSASRTASNTFMLGGTLEPTEYRTVTKTDAGGRISLTNSGGYVWLEDTYGLTAYSETLARYESVGSALQGYSYALTSDGSWQWTSTPQPYGDNVITLPAEASCPDGKYRNPDTNRCRTLEDALGELMPCGEGKERNPETNRCRNIASTASTLTACKEGQERNPSTNRCRSIASAIAELLPCDEGYERNPTTNRCRKVRDTNVLGAEYPVEPYKQEGVALATWWVVGGIAALAAGYGVWEWRREIGAGLARVLRRRK